MTQHLSILSFFFFNDTATTEIYTLSLHDALPIYDLPVLICRGTDQDGEVIDRKRKAIEHFLNLDRKSTRLNSSHQIISYAVFCLKKKNARRFDGSVYENGFFAASHLAQFCPYLTS